MEKGYIHIYTGDGKGKTTAAIGLAIRALGAGKKVYIGQFIKGMKYSEYRILEEMDNLKIQLLGRDCFIDKDPDEEDLRLAQEGLKTCKDILGQGNYDLVILDEVTIALFYKLFTVDQLIEVLKKKADHVEVVLTGRSADERLIEMADLVTEMKEIKHYYRQGILSREGIDC